MASSCRSAIVEAAIDRGAVAPGRVAGNATGRDDVAAREFVGAASKDSAGVAVRRDNELPAVAPVDATAVCASHRYGSNLDCDRSFDDSNRDSDLTVAAAASTLIHDSAAAEVVRAGAVRSAVVAVAANADHVPVNCGSGHRVVVPSVADVPESYEFDLVAAVRNGLDSDAVSVAPDPVAPGAVVAPGNSEPDLAAVAPNAVVVPENSESDLVAVAPSVVVVPVAERPDVAPAPHVDLPVPFDFDFGALRVAPDAPAVVVRVRPGSARCVPAHDHGGPERWPQSQSRQKPPTKWR